MFDLLYMFSILMKNFIFYLYYFFNYTFNVNANLNFFLVYLVVVLILMLSTAFLTFLERKKMSSFQHSSGPNKVGFFGLLQPFSDAFKLMCKEIILPRNAILFMFVMAPILSSVFGFLNWILFSYSGMFSIMSDMNLTLFFLFSISSLHVYSIILAGWSSNSSYSFLGAVRSSAQLMAYDMALGVIILNIVLLTKNFNLLSIILIQYKCGYLIYYYFFLFILFFVCCIAETNRHPFDLPEAESELVSGYNVEYSSINFAFFFLGEYTAMLFMSGLIVNIFWGGWLSSFYYLKILILIFFFIMLRAELPSYSYDQLMDLGWKVILPFSLYLFMWNFFSLFLNNSFLIDFLGTPKIMIF